MIEQARRFNDGSLEIAIAVGRASSLGSALLCVVFAAALWWWPMLVAFAYWAGAGWLCWWHFGNSSWSGKTIRMCGKHSPGGGLICNVAITEDNLTHVGLHGDGLRDPEGAQWWR